MHLLKAISSLKIPQQKVVNVYSMKKRILQVVVSTEPAEFAFATYKL